MSSSSDILLTEEEKKIAKQKLKKMQQDGGWRVLPLECEICHEMFTQGEPCPAHWEEVRETHIAIVIERQNKADWKYDNASNHKLDPYGLWDVAKRLQSITHSRRVT